MKIYHNPRCSKSRQTLQIIKDAGAEVEIIEYLNEVPSQDELAAILIKLGMNAEDILRKGEDIFKQNYKGKTFSNDEWIKIMIENPKLIERPIVIKGNKAVLGRPPENVNKFL